ncbi:hypothetical protein [Peristeroidobacter agariperforans]|uniref:hypothetical protein n=1 Tax=Peristeroidobacter agariperforans TaxID=268404 RepID=UPI00101C0CA9|nr:hypothetical protein [Peristeroidobacter agariperforans]
MGGPVWLALVAVVWWAALLNPSQARTFSTGIFDGLELPAATVSADRQLSLQTSDRRRTDSARDGSSSAVLAPAAIVHLSVEPTQWFGATTHRPIARPIRSPAQPRAPPANT